MISVDCIIFLKLMMNDEEWDKIGFWGSLLIIYICISPAAQVRLRLGNVNKKQVFPWPLLSLALTLSPE